MASAELILTSFIDLPMFFSGVNFFQLRSVSVSIFFIRHISLFFRSYSSNLPIMLVIIVINNIL